MRTPDATNPASTTLELDEPWSFVARKIDQAWIWIALCPESRKAGRLRGRRSKPKHLLPSVGSHSFRKLVLAIVSLIDSPAYQAVIPEEQHSAVGKETGEMAYVERWNKTLRQRLARFVRKTLSFSPIPVHA